MSGIFINSDAWNFWLDNQGNMTADAVRKDVEFYAAQGGVEGIFYNMNFQRSFYPTKVGTPIWKDCEILEDGSVTLRGEKLPPDVADEYRAMIAGGKELNEKVPDFMQIRYDHCKKIGVEMWHSMRMNDVHWTPLGQEFRPQHCDLWVERKDLLRAWYRHTQRSIWHDNAFDYGKQEVYDYHIAMVREYLLDYESDGIELDWLRACPVFKPGYDEINTPIFTQFMRDVRKAADEAAEKWGHRVRVAARVPTYVNEAMGMGMNVAAWCREGLIDILSPGPIHHQTEQDTQVQLWRLIAPEPVILAPCVNCTAMSAPGWSIESVNESDFGFVSNFYQQGADTIYVYNHFQGHGRRYPQIHDFFRLAGDRAAVAKEHRRHILTKHLPAGEGVFERSCYPCAVWAKCCNGGIKINCGEGTEGRSARIILGTTREVDVDVLLNTVKCELLPADTPLPSVMPKKSAYYVQAKVPAGILHDGWNDVELFNNGEKDINENEFVWLEVEIF